MGIENSVLGETAIGVLLRSGTGDVYRVYWQYAVPGAVTTIENSTVLPVHDRHLPNSTMFFVVLIFLVGVFVVLSYPVRYHYICLQ